jgi:hypothetical protein
MTKIFRHPAKVGLLLALLMGLLGTGQCEMAMKIWAGLQEQLDSQKEQLDSQKEQLDSQQDQICLLYEASDLPFPPQCFIIPECPEPDECDNEAPMM